MINQNIVTNLQENFFCGVKNCETQIAKPKIELLL